jgi:hypothetical protein
VTVDYTLGHHAFFGMTLTYSLLVGSDLYDTV